MSKPLTVNPSSITRKLRAAGFGPDVYTTGGLPPRSDGDFSVGFTTPDAELADTRQRAIVTLAGMGYVLVHRGDRLLTFTVPQAIISVQPSAFTDNLWGTESGEIVEGTKLPYPFHARKNDGRITRQDFWGGTPWRIMGFSRTPEPGRIDLYWRDGSFQETPDLAVGLYVVTQDRDGGMSVWQTAVASVTVTEVSA